VFISIVLSHCGGGGLLLPQLRLKAVHARLQALAGRGLEANLRAQRPQLRHSTCCHWRRALVAREEGGGTGNREGLEGKGGGGVQTRASV